MTSAAQVALATVLKRGDGGGPEVFNAVAEVISFGGPDGEPTVIDVSHLGSTARDKLVGLLDEGQVTLTLNHIPGDAEQSGMRADRATIGQTPRNYQLVLPDATTITFAALVLSFNIAGDPDSQVTLAVTLEVSGLATWT
jgi:predicted secreted protein